LGAVVLLSCCFVSGCGGPPDEPTDSEKGDGTTATAKSAIAGFMGGMESGSATFVQNGTDVFLSVSLKACVPTPKPVAGMPPPVDTGYPVSIYEGTSCDDLATLGAEWARGGGIANIPCSATSTGWVVHTVPNAGDTGWTIGGDALTNVIGHLFVVHKNGVPDAPPPVACGVIVDPNAMPASP
jgi:hypothetical protein